MPGLKKTTYDMTRKEVLAAVDTMPPGQDYIWDGVDEDDRPATVEEMQVAVTNARRRGRPVGSDKTQIALRVDNATLEVFKATGKGWQSRMNEALKDWLKTHSPL
jgi:uncharacterized protein (DUF4415 family)